MGAFNYKSFALISLLLLLLTLFITNVLTASNPIQGQICKMAFCGEGTCEAVDKFPFFDCICKPGWTKLNLSSSIHLPSCVIPSCGSNFQCGNDSSSSPLPPPSYFQLPNFPDPCMINLCGPEGTCQRRESDFTCQCSEGFANLLNNPKLPCFKKCSLGADCYDQPQPPTPARRPANSIPSTSGGTVTR